jgi:hypothetical protein
MRLKSSALFLDALAREGFARAAHRIGPDATAALCATMDSLATEDACDANRRRGNQTFARRNLLALAEIRAIAHSSEIRKILIPVLGPQARPVRGILFDKSRFANWTVPWHQDLSIAVNHRINVPGFGPWSIKAGVHHVQPPVDILQQMLTIRLHLDDCDADNGPLKVIPGSHRAVLSAAELARIVEAGPRVECLIPAGGALVMRPMLVHGSSPARRPAHRRVIHLEFAACDLPGDLQWHQPLAGAGV